MDALERLLQSNNNEEYSLEERMSAAEVEEEDEDFLNAMSNDSKNALMNKLHEVVLDEEDTNLKEKEVSENVVTNDDSSIISNKLVNDIVENSKKTNNEEKPKRKRGRRKKVEEQPQVTNNKVSCNPISVNSDDTFIPIMNQLAKDLLDELITSDYKISRFDSNQMQIVYNYMYSKF